MKVCTRVCVCVCVCVCTVRGTGERLVGSAFRFFSFLFVSLLCALFVIATQMSLSNYLKHLHDSFRVNCVREIASPDEVRPHTDINVKYL